MDEIYIKSQGKEKYITIVRDLKSGAVLYVVLGRKPLFFVNLLI